MGRNAFRVGCFSLALAAIVVFAPAALCETWDSGGANSNWSTGLNWNTNLAPANDGTANIFFGSGANTSPNVDTPWDIRSLTFNAGAASFALSGSALTIRNGITNNSPNAQSVGPISLGAAQNWTMNAGTLTVQNNLSTFGFDLEVDGAGNLTLARAMTGAGALTKTGNGTLTLGAGSGDNINNTYSGLTDIFGGTLILDKAAGTIAIAHDLIAEGGSTITANRAGQFGPQTNITLNGGVINFGASTTMGTLTIISGGLSAGGTLSVSGTSQYALTLGGAIGISGINLTGASGGGVKLLNNNSSASNITGPVNMGGVTREFNVAENAFGPDLSLTGIVSAGGILKTGPGELALTNVSNSYAGGTNISSGEILASNDGALGSGSAPVIFTGGVFGNATAFSSARNFAFLGAGIIDTNAGNLTLTGPITGSGPAAKWSNYNLTIGGGAADTNPNTYNGAFNVTGGTLILDKAANTIALAGDINLTGFGSVLVNRLGQLSQSANITLSTFGSLTVPNSTTIGSLSVYSSTGVAGDMTLTTSAPSALTIAAGNYMINNFYISSLSGGGVTLVNTGPYASTLTGSIGLNGIQRTFTIPDDLPGDDLTISGEVYFGSLQKLGSGTLALTAGFNSLTTLTISEGTVRVPGVAALGGGNIVIAPIGTLQTSGTFTTTQQIQSDGTISTDAGTTLTIGSGITGGSLTKTGPGELLLFNANHTVGSVRVNDGTLTLSGGSLASGVINNATFKYQGGSIAGQFVNYGNLLLDANLTLPAGMSNYANFTIPLNTALVTNGPGLSNLGTISMDGGTLNGAGPLTNWSKIIGWGTISGAGQVSNQGLIHATGLLYFFSQASFIFNNGQIDVPIGSQMAVDGANLLNTGNITVGGGLIYGPSQLINAAGGTLTGHGVVSLPLSNSGGTIVVTDGTLNITNNFSSSGAIALAGITAALGGGTITNTGSIHGFGGIANLINNNAGGTIEATGGNLILSGSGSTNLGLIAASTGNKVLFAQGLAMNAGVISLSGGTFDNNGRTMTNTGEISGYGSFRTGGLTNNGSITFTGGVTTINGNVTNSAGKQIKVAYNPALFTGNVVNNGIFKSTSTTVTFAGTYTENGTFISDPADNYFNHVSIGSSGAWVGGVGDRFFVSGDLLNQSTSNQWNTDDAELHLLTGGDGDVMQVNGRDLGVSFDGYDNNFAWGVLSLAAGRSLSLADANTIPGGAIYVDHLDLEGGIAQIADITGNGMTLYYHLGDPNNAYLGGKSYQLAGGGNITPVPEPGQLFAGITALAFLAHRQRKSATLWRRV